MITVVDYGLGNIRAFTNMYKRMNIATRVATTEADLVDAVRIVLPGVGAFDHAMGLLHASGMRPRLESLVREHAVPVLGVCVGMQILADASEEGSVPGLSWVPGRVRSFASDPRSSSLPLPHMGWNDVAPDPTHPRLFKGLEGDARFYFLHSFFFECVSAADVAATSCYGMDFACAVHSGNVYGVQFHPEKSHHYGVALLKNFSEI